MILAEMWVKFLGDATDLQKKTVQAQKDIETFGRNMESIGQRLAVAVSLPLVAGAVAAAKVAGEMEQNAVAFTTLLKSADAAKEHMEALQSFALKTPFQFPELVRSSRLMQAMGFSVGRVIPMMTTLGNAVSAMGGGNDMLQRIILSFGQMQARGKLTGEEIRELAHANVPALALVATKLGITTAQAMKQMEAGGISAKVAMAAILEYMETRFKGGMEAQSQTMLGMWSNVRDKITFTLADIGKAMLPMAKDVIANYINPLLDKIRELAGEFSKLPPVIQTVAVATAALAAVAPMVIWGLGTLVTSAAAVAKAFGPMFTALTSGAAKAVPALATVAVASDVAAGAVASGWKAATGAVTQAAAATAAVAARVRGGVAASAAASKAASAAFVTEWGMAEAATVSSAQTTAAAANAASAAFGSYATRMGTVGTAAKDASGAVVASWTAATASISSLASKSVFGGFMTQSATAANTFSTAATTATASMGPLMTALSKVGVWAAFAVGVVLAAKELYRFGQHVVDLSGYLVKATYNLIPFKEELADTWKYLTWLAKPWTIKIKAAVEGASKQGLLGVGFGGLSSVNDFIDMMRSGEGAAAATQAGFGKLNKDSFMTIQSEMEALKTRTATMVDEGRNGAVALDKAWKAVSLKDLRKELKDMVAGYAELRKAGVLSLADIWKVESEIAKLQRKIGDRERGLTGEQPKPRQFEFDPLMEARIKGSGKSLQEWAAEVVKAEQAAVDWGAATIGTVRPLTESQQALKLLLNETVGATGGLLALMNAQDQVTGSQGQLNQEVEKSTRQMDKYAAALAGLGLDKRGGNVAGWLKDLDELSSRFQGAEADAQRLAFAMEFAGISKPREQVEKLAWAMGELNRQNDGSVEAWRRSMLAVIAWTDAAVEAGDTIDREWLAEIEKLRAALGKRPPTVLFEGIRNAAREISTALDKMGESISEIIWPRGGTSTPAWLATQQKAVAALNDAYQDLAARGYNDPKRALEEIIARIKSAGTAAEANALAIRHFGSAGVEMAAMIRNGTLSADQFAESLKVATGEMAQLSAEVQKEANGIQSIFEEVARAVLKSIVVIIVEQGLLKLMKVLGLVKQDVASLEEAFGSLIGKIAGAVASWVGFGKKTAETAASAGQVAGGAGQAAGGIAGGAGSAAGGVASGAAGMAGNMATAWIGAISSAVSAVSGVISNFQMAGMNKSLDLIEHEVRYSQLHLLALLDKANLTWPALTDLMGYLWTVQMPYLQKICAAVEAGFSFPVQPQFAAAGVGSESASITNIYIDGLQIASDPETRDLAERFARHLRAKGVRATPGIR